VSNQAEKKRKVVAAYYTLGISVALLFFLLLVSWTIPQPVEPIVNDGIEVNLGNSDFGKGDVAPSIKGEPAPEAKETKTASPPPSQPEPQPEDKSEADENDPTPANTKTVEKPKRKIPNDNPPVQKPVVTKAPPAPPQPKPKATMGNYAGGNGKGGNNGDAFNNVKNQGIAGGNGDQGKPNGNPKSDNYTGNGGTGKGGVTVVRGNRSVVRATRLSGEFDHDATLYIDVQVSADGTGTFLRVTKGYNASQYTSIIRQRLASRDIMFSTGGDETVVNIRVDFKVGN
jgi:hypothetical protein